jgi:hypothetical protein
MSAYPIPAFVYTPVSTPVIWIPTYPPIKKPVIDDRFAVRYDTDSLSGLRQTFFVRTEIWRTLNFENVLISELTSWGPFIDFAMTGKQFHYHSDGTLPAYETFTLDQAGGGAGGGGTQQFQASFVSFGLVKFALIMRKVLGADGSGWT